MKRFFTVICIALFSMMTTACLNYDEPTKDVVAVRFTLGGTKVGPITKATDSELQNAVNAAALYSTPVLSLTSTSNPSKTYTATVGMEVMLPLGTYTVEALLTGQRHTTSPFGTVYTTPCGKIEKTIEVTATTRSIALTVEPTCFALVLDRSVTTKYRIDHANMVDGLSIFPNTDAISVVFITPGDSSSETCTATLKAVNATGGEKDYPVSWNWATGGTHLETGKWYAFAASASTIGATFSVDYGSFVHGE